MQTHSTSQQGVRQADWAAAFLRHSGFRSCTVSSTLCFVAGQLYACGPWTSKAACPVALVASPAMPDARTGLVVVQLMRPCHAPAHTRRSSLVLLRLLSQVKQKQLSDSHVKLIRHIKAL